MRPLQYRRSHHTPSAPGDGEPGCVVPGLPEAPGVGRAEPGLPGTPGLPAALTLGDSVPGLPAAPVFGDWDAACTIYETLSTEEYQEPKRHANHHL